MYTYHNDKNQYSELCSTYSSAASQPTANEINCVGKKQAVTRVKKAVKLLAMPLFYGHYKDIINQHIVY